MSTVSGVIETSTRPISEPPPQLAGWAGAASAVHAIQRMAIPMTLLLDVARHGSAGHETMTLDFAYNAFTWDGSLDDFPAAPESVHVETRPGFPDGPSLHLPGRPLDPLLWLIGYHAFGDELAPWLSPDHRHRLRRWPSLSGVEIDLDQVRMIAMLGNAFATVDELAAAAHTSPPAARRLVNAFSVAGILRHSTGTPAASTEAETAAKAQPPATAPSQPDARPASTHGLFARLRERWGR